jgi:preprotein translocase subunit SecA
MAMFEGCVAEMRTGEGKTLTATLPLYLRAISGKGAHVATVNDYLAARDAQTLGPIYRFLGLSVGTIQSQMTPSDRRQAYACDITYGTAKEFGFDFLRDRLLLHRLQQVSGEMAIGLTANQSEGNEKPVQRGSHFVLVDEADSVLIDDARTPLIISALPGPAQQQIVAAFRWAASVADQFHETSHYEFDHEKRTVELNFAGRQLVRTLPKAEALDTFGYVDFYEYVERAIKVRREFFLDQHYIVRNGEIVIVDESTGRVAEGRKWSRGIHQAVEAKEGVEVTVDSGQAARITVQDYFQRYQHVAGMTGTAATSSHEFRKIYKLPVVVVPTHRPERRDQLPDRVFATGEQKWAAIVAEVQEMHGEGRPVLIGTRTIEASELLSRKLFDAQIEHQVLNAHSIAKEAEIIAKAGELGRVTVATNMAGRGTDIKLGEGVEELGGLHVICTELHDSARIDRQLVGRCGRQGDPGSFRLFMSLEDDVLVAGLRPQAAAQVQKSAAGECEVPKYRSLFRNAQRRVERRHYRQRMVLLHHEKQIKKMHREMGQDPYLESPH